MSFVYPSFLFALFAISIPIIIHLFNFRRFRKIYFSDIRFLKEVKQQTQNKNRIKHLLILASRILAVSFLVFAFAQPFIPADKKNAVAGIQSVSVFVDNSFSMENVSRNGLLLDEAKKMAREIALSYSQSDLFQLLTNDFEGKHQRLVSREEFLTMLDEIKISPAVKSISEIYSRQSDALSRTETKVKKNFIISDFQKSISDFAQVKADTGIRTILLPVPANQQSNLYIDSCWFETPVLQSNQNAELHVRILSRNHDEELTNQPVKLFINGQQKTPTTFTVEGGSGAEIILPFVLREPGIQQGRIEITDHPVTFDDKFYFSFEVAKNIAVTCISPALPDQQRTGVNSLESLYGKDSLFVFSVQDENRIDYSALALQHVIVLSELKSLSSGLAQELSRFVQNGGSLVVFPSAESDTNSYRSFLSSLGTNFFVKKDTANTKVDWINYESAVFSDVFDKESMKKNDNLDLPLALNHFSFSRLSRTNEEALMKMKNGEPFFSKYSFKKGKVYLSAVPLNDDWSNFARHAIFVPLMYKIALGSQPVSELFYTVGNEKPIPLPSVSAASAGSVYKITGENSFEVIPELRTMEMQPSILLHGQIVQAGNYLLKAGTPGLAGEQSLSGLSFNYDRKESNLERYTAGELVTLYENAALKNFSLIDVEDKDVSKVLADMSRGTKLWKWCILFALLFLAAEVLLLRFWK